jgi:ketol-acid reductoisomerase
MLKKFYEADADIGVLKGKRIAVIGYGSQGRGQSLNLRDSGLDVVIGLRPGKSWDAAAKDGMKVMKVADAVKGADIIQILVPDEHQGAIYKNEILPHLKENKCLMFSHGFNIHFGQIVPPATVDVIMVAPNGPPPVRGRQRGASTHCCSSGPHGQCAQDCSCLCQGYRSYPRGRA